MKPKPELRRALIAAMMSVLLAFLIACAASGGESDDGENDGGAAYSCDIQDNPNAPTEVEWWIDRLDHLQFANECDAEKTTGMADNGIAWTVTWCCAVYPPESGLGDQMWVLEFINDRNTGYQWELMAASNYGDGECDPDCVD